MPACKLSALRLLPWFFIVGFITVTSRPTSIQSSSSCPVCHKCPPSSGTRPLPCKFLSVCGLTVHWTCHYHLFFLSAISSTWSKVMSPWRDKSSGVLVLLHKRHHESWLCYYTTSWNDVHMNTPKVDLYPSSTDRAHVIVFGLTRTTRFS